MPSDESSICDHLLVCSSSSLYQIGISQVFQLAVTCSKLTIETLEQGVKYVQS